MNKIYIVKKKLKKIDKKSMLRMDRINIVLENKL
jgi:hypothetical protein